MVRTKQMAKKSTGGEAPCVTIKLVPNHQSAAATALQLSARPKPPEMPSMSIVPDRQCVTSLLSVLPTGNAILNNDMCCLISLNESN